MKRSKIFLTVKTLKEERLTAPPVRQDEIDEEIKQHEPGLSHEEAVAIVRQYEMGSAAIQAQEESQQVALSISPSVEITEWNAPDPKNQGAPRLWQEVAWGRSYPPASLQSRQADSAGVPFKRMHLDQDER